MKMTRRYFLKSTGLLSLYCGLTPSSLLADLNIDSNKKVKRNKTLVVIFLRGGMDGLNFIIPYSDPHYYNMRPSIGISKPGKQDGVIDLDGFFGLHPRAEALNPLFKKNAMIALHAVGYAEGTRSHFKEQDVWETGVIGNTIHSDGWLNRHLFTSTGHGPIRAISLGSGLPRILRGKAPAYSIRGLNSLSVPKEFQNSSMMAALENAYDAQENQAVQILSQASKETLESVAILEKVAQAPYKANATYPDTPLANKLQETARLIKSNIGIEVVELDYGGWDTHRNQGGIRGRYGNMVEELSKAIAAFFADLDNKMDDVLLMTLSDFGRTARQNGTNGTDHGWANCMLLMGGNVGKTKEKVICDWPGLAPEQLYQNRDLKHTTDFRDVLSEIVTSHLGNENLSKILPQHDFKKVGFLL